MAIMMAICTTGIILLLFCTREANRLNATMILCVSFVGYLYSYMYYDNYKKIKNGKKIL